MIKCSRILVSAIDLDIPMAKPNDPNFAADQEAAYGASADTSPSARA